MKKIAIVLSTFAVAQNPDYSKIEPYQNTLTNAQIHHRLGVMVKSPELYDQLKLADTSFEIFATKEDKEKAHKILGLCINIVKILSALIQPIMPVFASKLQEQLNLNDLKWTDIDFKTKIHKLGKEKILISNDSGSILKV